MATPDAASPFGAALHHAFERSPDAQLIVDDERRIVAANGAARSRFGLGAEALGARVDDVLPTPAAAVDPWRPLWEHAVASPAPTARLRLAAGAIDATLTAGAPGELHLLVLRDAGPGSDARAGTLQAVADSSHDALIALDADGRVATVSARAALVVGASERALLGRALSVVVEEGGRDDLDALVRTALDGADVFQHDTRARPRDGHTADITINLAPLRDPRSGQIIGVSVIIQDITERKRLERLLRHRSERDALTDLYNRRHFEIELRRAARLAERHGHSGAVVLLDVDRFKDVNDTRGHPAGDRLLSALAGALTGCLRDSDVAARLGGDEFAVLLPNTSRRGAAAAAKKVMAAARAAMHAWHSSISAGTASFGPGTTFDPELVMTAADQALYRAKATGGDALDVADGTR